LEDKKRQSFLKIFQEAWEAVRDEKLVASAVYLSVNSGATFQVIPVEPKDKTHTGGTLYLWESSSAIPPSLIQDFGEKAKNAIKNLKPGDVLFLDNVRKFAGETENHLTVIVVLTIEKMSLI
jgi:hypothetical protein